MLKLLKLLAVSLLFVPIVFAEVKVGDDAPMFLLFDQNGKEVMLNSEAGKITVLEWTNPNCPFVKRHYKTGTMKKMIEEFSKENVQWISINSTSSMTADDNKKWGDQHQITWPILSDQSGEVGKAYGAKTTPHMFVIDSKGKVAYIGAIDDDAEGAQDKALNYVVQAVKELVGGKPVTVAQTKSYGCSVKYAS